jgi:putative DNA primase/helicase
MANDAPVDPLARLLPGHLADLRKSGLSDLQIAACGFYSLQAPATIKKVLRWGRYNGQLGCCLAIPFCDASGRSTGYVRLKPDSPRKGKVDGKPVKYESPKGLANQAYFPPATRAVLSDATIPLLVTEGEKKSAKADQDGFPCVGLVGVYGWQKKRANKEGEPRGERELIDALASIPWQGRSVCIVYDSDAATNPNVRRAEWHLAECLARHGAKVKVGRLPQGDAGPGGTHSKVGLDDFLVAHGPDALRRLLAEAADPTPPDPSPIEAGDDPHRLARLYVAQSCVHDDGRKLHLWREEWHRWDGTAYRIVPAMELRAELTASAKREMDRLNVLAQIAGEQEKPRTVRKITGRLVSDVALALQSLTVLNSRVKAPAWLNGKGPFPADEILVCRNGLIHLPTLVEGGKGYFVLPTPRFFSPNCLDFDFNPNAPRPGNWLNFLHVLWRNDQQSIDTLQECFGYCLTQWTELEKIFLLVGPTRSGKGTIARILRRLVGVENVAGPTLSSLSQNFGLAPLLGRTLAIISDARLGGRADVAVIAERLLSISGEDSLTVDRKFLSAVDGPLPIRFLILSNELPRLADSSGALPSRFIIWQLLESFLGREDTGLTAKLLAELPGILLWAIAGWQRLRDRGRFVQPDSATELVQQLSDLASPVGAFVRECCKIGSGHQVEKDALYDAWKIWCQRQGRDHPGDKSSFGRNLRAAVSAIKDSKPRTQEGRSHVYEGICLIRPLDGGSGQGWSG